MSQTLTVLLTGIAALSLLVGGIGVMNIMLVSVTERTREIGLRKALGAPPAAIRRQFLVEATVLGLCGGILGAAVGIAGARRPAPVHFHRPCRLAVRRSPGPSRSPWPSAWSSASTRPLALLGWPPSTRCAASSPATPQPIPAPIRKHLHH